MAVRKVSVGGTVFVVDHETFGSNETETAPISGETFLSEEGKPSKLVEMAVGVGGEVRVEVAVRASLSTNNVVRVDGLAKLFEGDDETTDDLEDDVVIDEEIFPDEPLERTYHLRNSGAGGGDRADITLTFTNRAANLGTAAGDGSLPSQDNWRWCHKCAGLHFAGGDSLGRCVTGGAHDVVGSGNYALMHQAPADIGQHSWRWCRKCNSLFFGGHQTTGRCPAGGSHDGSASGDYSLIDSNPTDPGQHDWRWCHQCEGLHFAGGATLGPCPSGGLHRTDGSGDYSLTIVG